MVSNNGCDASSFRCSTTSILSFSLARQRTGASSQTVTYLRGQLYPPLPAHGEMLWPISPVTLTEFCWSHAKQERHHLSPLNRLMSRQNTVKVSLHFGQEMAIFLLLFWYICSSALLIAQLCWLLTARRTAAFYWRMFSPGTKEGTRGHERESQADLVA